MAELPSEDEQLCGVEACFLAMRGAESAAKDGPTAAPVPSFSFADVIASYACLLPKQTPEQEARSRFKQKAALAAKRRVFAQALASTANRPLLQLLRGEFGFLKSTHLRRARS